jgi:hypothetical protein
MPTSRAGMPECEQRYLRLGPTMQQHAISSPAETAVDIELVPPDLVCTAPSSDDPA